MTTSGVERGLLSGQIIPSLEIFSTLLAGTLILFILYVRLRFFLHSGRHGLNHVFHRENPTRRMYPRSHPYQKCPMASHSLVICSHSVDGRSRMTPRSTLDGHPSCHRTSFSAESAASAQSWSDHGPWLKISGLDMPTT